MDFCEGPPLGGLITWGACRGSLTGAESFTGIDPFYGAVFSVVFRDVLPTSVVLGLSGGHFPEAVRFTLDRIVRGVPSKCWDCREESQKPHHAHGY